MAATQVTYANKVATIPPGVAINQCQDVDLNELKSAINDNADILDLNVTEAEANTADIVDILAMTAEVEVPIPIILPFTFPENTKTTLDSLHGGLRQTGSQSGIVLNSVQTITDTIGQSKIYLVVNAGSDYSGNITITGTSVDRNTGIETAADSDVIPITSLTSDNSRVDANGNIITEFVHGYISSKWFKGAITLSTTNVTLTDIDVYQVAFDQFNDSEDITVDTIDMTFLTSNTSAELDCYLYAVDVSGISPSVCDITLLARINHATGQSINFYRERIGNIAHAIDGSASGVFVDLFLLPASAKYFDSFSLNVWATKQETVAVTINI